MYSRICIPGGYSAVLLPVSSPLVFSLTWSWKYKSDGLTAAFDTGSYDIREFFAILFGNVKEGYRVAVKDRFFEAVGTQKISWTETRICTRQNTPPRSRHA